MLTPFRFIRAIFADVGSLRPEPIAGTNAEQEYQSEGPTWLAPVTDNFIFDSDVVRQSARRTRQKQHDASKSRPIPSSAKSTSSKTVKPSKPASKKSSLEPEPEPEVKPFRLLDLPPEIRAKILRYAVVDVNIRYVYVLSDTFTTQTQLKPKGPGPYAHHEDWFIKWVQKNAKQTTLADAIRKGKTYIDIPAQPGITRVSTQLRKEALPMYYYRNQWQIIARPQHFMDILYFFPQINYLLTAPDAETRYRDLITYVFRSNSQDWKYVVACFRDVYEYRTRFPWLKRMIASLARFSIDTFIDDAIQQRHLYGDGPGRYYDVLEFMLQFVIKTEETWSNCLRSLETIRDASWLHSDLYWTGPSLRDTMARSYLMYKFQLSNKYILNLGNPRPSGAVKKFLEQGGQIQQRRLREVELVSRDGYRTLVSAKEVGMCRKIKLIKGKDGAVTGIDLIGVAEIEPDIMDEGAVKGLSKTLGD